MTPSIPVGKWRALIEAAAAVAGQAELDDVISAAVSTASSVTGARYAALGVIGSHGTLVEFIHQGLDPGVAEQIGHLPQGHGVLGTIIRTRETVRVDDIGRHPDSVGFPPHHPTMTAFLGVPVRVREEVFGNLYLTDKPGGFTAEDAELVEALAVIVGAAVANARVGERLRHWAVTEDRERIARDLHDAIIQDLFAVGLQLQGAALRSEEAFVRAAIDDAVGRLDQAITSLRRFIFDLRSIPAGPRLGARLDEVVESVTRGRPLAVSVTVSPPGLQLDEGTSDEILSMVREAVSNSTRHAAAARLDVSVTRRESGLSISVIDDGTGFDPDRVSAGMGLANLRKRVEKLGGKLHIDSTLGSGTAVQISVPTVG